MKKFLLSLLAVIASVNMFAYSNGDYIYTQTAKFKVSGDNLVPALSAWQGADNVDVWSVYTGEDATENCLLSMDGSESATALFKSVQMKFGETYVISLKFKAPADASTSVTDAAQNQVDVWAAKEESDGTKSGEAGTNYFQIAESKTLVGGEWTEVTFAYTDTAKIDDEEVNALNIKIGRLSTETVVADVEVYKVVSVYDTRIIDRKIAFIDQLKASGAFTGDRGDLDEVIEAYQEGEYNIDDANEMEGVLENIDEATTIWMDETSDDMSSNFANIGITGIAKYNRGTIKDGQIINNFIFHGDNWLHSQGSDVLNKQIQQGYGNNAGSVALYNTNIPSGEKYYIAFEVRVGNLTSKSSVYTYTWTREDSIKAFIGSDSIELGSIKGEDWTKFFMVGDLKEGETFEAGVWWPGHTTTSPGSTFQVRNFEVRSIRGEGESVADKIARQEAFAKFLAQYNAAVSAQKNVQAAIGNSNYPWNQEELQESLTRWTPNIEAVASWVDAEGNDTKVATKEELDAWPTAQGEEIDPDDNTTWYPVVRGLQNAYNAAVAANKPYVELKAVVAEAKDAMASGKYKSDDSELKASVSDSEALIAAVDASAPQTEEFADQVISLQAVLAAYYAGSASYATPAEIAIVNGGFTEYSGSSTGGEVSEKGGWTCYSNVTQEYFRFGAASEFASGARVAMWRGWTGNPRGNIYQEVLVSKAGHYQLVCQAYVTGDNIKINNGIRNINVKTEIQEVYDEDFEEWIEEEVEIGRDTVYHSGVYLEFDDASKEMVSLGSAALGNVTENRIEIYTSKEVAGDYNPQWFTLNLDVTEPNTTLRIGLNGLNVGYDPDNNDFAEYGPNAYGIGSVHVYYYGPSDEYYKDAEAAEGDYNPYTTAVKTVAAPAKAIASGVYSLTGVKVANSLSNSLPKGIYIVGGKKYLVK